MPTVSYNQLGPWNQAAYARMAAMPRPVPKSAVNCDTAVEWEFSEAMRSPRFPAGWFVLPSVLLGCLLLLPLLY